MSDDDIDRVHGWSVAHDRRFARFAELNTNADQQASGAQHDLREASRPSYFGLASAIAITNTVGAFRGSTAEG